MTLRERFRSPDSYGLLLVLILFSLVAAAAQGDRRWSQILAIVLGGAVVAVIVSNLGEVRRGSRTGSAS
jgi:hypothetical protein